MSTTSTSTDKTPPDETTDAAGQDAADVNPLLLPPRRWTTELYRPDVQQRLDEMIARIDELEAARVAGGGPAKKQGRKPEEMTLAEKHDELAKTATQLRMEFEEPIFDVYQAVIDSCPPREGNPADQQVGYDRDAVTTELVWECLQTVDGREVTRDQYDQFRATVSAINWTKIRNDLHLNVEREPDLPKPFAVSALQRRRAHGSQQQPDTASPPAGSKE